MDNLTSSKGSILITGASGTLGSAIVSGIVSSTDLASLYGLYTVRDAQSVPALRVSLAQKTQFQPHYHDILSLDLSSLANVRQVAGTINARVASGEIPAIRALILNAGYMEFDTQSWSEDGYDLTFATNYLGHWLLTLLLLQSMDKERGRIVVVGSESHDPYNSKNQTSFGNKKWKTFIHENTEAIAKGTWSAMKDNPTYSCGYRRYGASKFCLAMMIGELQRRLNVDPALNKLCVLGVDPGSMPGNLTRRGPWIVRVFLFKLIMPWLAPLMGWLQPNGSLRTAHLAAPDILRASLDTCQPIGESPKGLYLRGIRLGEVTAEAQDVKKREILWRDSVTYTKMKQEETSLKNWS